MPHTITGISPNLAAIGDVVTISGTGFGAVQGASTVFFGAIDAGAATGWSDTQITIAVPASTVSARVVITVGGQVQTNDGQRWFELRDTTIRSIEGCKAQDETADSSPEDLRVADADEINDLLNLIANVMWRGVNDFRLTLASGDAVTTADQTAKSTVYLTPYKGNRIALYNGRVWEVLTSAEVSLALSGLTDAKNYDVFAYSNSGTLTLEFLAWTNDTTRATALARQDGIWVKSGTPTRRYVGTFRTTSTTTTEDSLAKRFLFNAENRVRRAMRAIEAENSWTYTTATWREARGVTTNRLQFVLGLAEDAVEAYVLALAENSSLGVAVRASIGVDSTSSSGADIYPNINLPAVNARTALPGATYRSNPGVGYHFLAWLEYSDATGTTTWYGDVGGIAQAGIHGSVLA